MTTHAYHKHVRHLIAAAAAEAVTESPFTRYTFDDMHEV